MGSRAHERAVAKRLNADEREAYEHLAATLEYDAPDVYPSRQAAEEAALELILQARLELALRASLRAESPPPPERGADD